MRSVIGQCFSVIVMKVFAKKNEKDLQFISGLINVLTFLRHFVLQYANLDIFKIEKS